MTTITRTPAPVAAVAAAALVPLPAVNECDRLYSVMEAAGLLGVSKHYVYERIHDGSILTVDLGQGTSKLRISATDLSNFILARRVQQ